MGEAAELIAERARLTLCLFAAALLITACSGEDRPAIGGPFHLVDQNGRPRDQSMLKGKWSAVFFGYTFCPDVCPTTLQALADAETRLGPDSARLQVVFVTVDPARDTPGQLKAYLSSSAFPKGAVGLTGAPSEVAAAAKAYKVFYQNQGTGRDYTVAHSSAVYLMDPRGRFERALTYDMAPAEMARQIAEAMGKG
jgi:protein SCO1/2